MQIVEVDLRSMEAELMRWSAKLDELRSKTKAAGSEARFDYRKRLDDVAASYKVAQSRLHRLQAAGSGKWETFKTDIESAWSDLETAFKKLTS